MTVTTVQQALNRGISLICATCVRYWDGRERGLEGDSCTTDTPCGGPISGLDFPNYQGPISDFEQICFVCGHRSELGIKIPGRPRVFGVCSDHLKLLDRLSAPKIHNGLSLHSASKGLIIPIRGRYTPKTLPEVIVETEEEWAEQDRDVAENSRRKWV